MGARIVYQIKDADGELVATLFSNSSHEAQFAEDVFNRLLAVANGPNELIENCLTARYETSEGNHEAGDRIFWILSEANAFGDYEAVVTVSCLAPSEELVSRGLAQAPTNKTWKTDRREWSNDFMAHQA